MSVPNKRDLIAQWAFDTRPLLLRFHLWLEDVEVEWLKGDPGRTFDDSTFVPGGLRRCLAMTAGLTALGTRLFGRFGDGKDKDKQTLNEVKKDADAISAYVMSESLWHFTRGLPENHAIMVSLGEGLMPKGGESPEMGANPLLGFGRVYARPSVAKFIDARVHRLLNDPGYGWDAFYRKMRERGITIWGAAVDTLENTSRFAKGEDLGPMAVLHLFDQPMAIARPYEAYMGSLTLPRSVVETAEEQSVSVDLHTPRRRLVEAIELTLPGIRREHIHVWTLGGKGRETRLGTLWKEWRELGVHLVEDGWTCPSGLPAFTESGTYAPTYLVGTWKDEKGAPHVFLCDGYAASAEAVQAASLAQALDVEVSLALFSPFFELPMDREHRLGRLDPEAQDFEARLARLFGGDRLGPERVDLYRRSLREMAAANLPLGRRALRADDFFPEKSWSVIAATGYMGPDPYSGLTGIERIKDDTWRVTTQLTARGVRQRASFTFRSLESFEQTRLVFSPLLERFMAGESYRNRAVKVSDSGRIRNELQTLCSQALEYTDDDRIRVHLSRIDDLVISAPRKRAIREVLEWYKANHPVWFRWLEIA
jgi:hypothetical protein